MVLVTGNGASILFTMYKIIGADGKEYGPITANQLRQWVTQGRTNALTQVRPEAESEWRPLGTLSEFTDALAQPPSFPNLPPPAPVPARTSGLAIASLILGPCGILSCGISSLVGIILGIVSLTQISKSQGRLKGQGLAIAGIIVSAFFILMMPAMMIPAFAKARAKAQSITCMNNAKQLAVAVVIHAQANTNSCPPAATWCDAIQPEISMTSVFQCPAGDKTHQSHYAYNAKLSGLNLDDVKNPAQTVLFFETDGGWNLSGGSELLPRKMRHNHGVVVGFVDGHVEVVPESRLSQLQWEP